MINGGIWLLLTVLFGGLLLIVQRAERSRRLLTLVLLLGVFYLVASYGLYRLSNDCPVTEFRQLCDVPEMRARAQVIASNTVIRAVISALIINGLFWVLIGRYNPPKSSDEIKVLGLND